LNTPIPSAPAAHVKLPPVLWLLGVGLAVALGVLLVASPRILALAVAGAAATAVVALAFVEPRWVVLAQIVLVATYGVYVLQGQSGVPLTPLSLVLLLVVGIGLRHVFRVERLSLPTRETLLLGALLGAMAVSTVLAVDREASRITIATYIQNAALVILLVALVDRPRWLRRAAWAFVIGVGFLAVLAVLQQLAHAYGSSFYGFAEVAADRGFLRSSGPLNANFFAQVLVAAAFLALYLGLGGARQRSRLGGFAAAALCVGAIWFTYSRGSLLVLCAMLVVVAVLRRVRPRVAAATLVVVVVGVAAVAPNRAAVKEQFRAAIAAFSDTAPSEGDYSIAGRRSENLAALRMFTDHPIIGVGTGNYPARYLEYSEEIGLDQRAEARNAHSLYLQQLSEIGIVGSIAFVALLWLGLNGAWRARRILAERDKLLAEGIFVALLGFLLNGIFLHLAYENYFWLVLGLALAAGRAGREMERRRSAALRSEPVAPQL
jgi:O-antigen ligase